MTSNPKFEANSQESTNLLNWLKILIEETFSAILPKIIFPVRIASRSQQLALMIDGPSRHLVVPATEFLRTSLKTFREMHDSVSETFSRYLGM